MNKKKISICICTYKRIKLLGHLLDKLQKQITEDLFEYSIVVVDNDLNQSSEKIVSCFSSDSAVNLEYFVEPEKGIAQARNMAVKNADGDFIVFIDDDEFPINNWLLNLYKSQKKYKADGVLGPVKPFYEAEPPRWILKGKICERSSFETGTLLKNPKYTRTGNVLLKTESFKSEEKYFRNEFGLTGGEDVDFFRRMIEKGKIFVWCNDAVVYETVPLDRLKRAYFLKRALLRGEINSKNTTAVDCLKSIAAATLYTSFLPLSIFFGQHVFMKYLIKNCDHIGKVLGVFGLKVINKRFF